MKLLLFQWTVLKEKLEVKPIFSHRPHLKLQQLI